MKTIDINCDMGESYGAWTMGADAEVMPHISSANVACGFHGGDPATIRKTVRLAVDHGVAIGAHPSFPDREHFGRREMQLSAEDLHACIVAQVRSLADVTAAAGARLRHVKPHGALYNMAARDEPLAEAVVAAVHGVDPSLAIFGLAGSALVKAASRGSIANE